MIQVTMTFESLEEMQAFFLRPGEGIVFRPESAIPAPEATALDDHVLSADCPCEPTVEPAPEPEPAPKARKSRKRRPRVAGGDERADLHNLGLSPRALGALYDAGHKTVASLDGKLEEIAKLKGVGKAAMQIIETALAKLPQAAESAAPEAPSESDPDPLDVLGGETEPEAETEPEIVTRAATAAYLRATLGELASVCGHQALRDFMAQLDAKRVDDVPEEKYGEVIEAAHARIGAAG